ncbi:MAG: hypothetical protein AAGI90_03340 [Chlamydiota bacterium]
MNHVRNHNPLLRALDALYATTPSTLLQESAHSGLKAHAAQDGSKETPPVIRVIGLSDSTCAHEVYQALKKSPAGSPPVGFGVLVRRCINALKIQKKQPKEGRQSTTKKMHCLVLMILGLEKGIPQFYALLSQQKPSDTVAELTFIQSVSCHQKTEKLAEKTLHSFLRIVSALRFGKKLSAKSCCIETHPYLSKILRKKFSPPEKVPNVNNLSLKTIQKTLETNAKKEHFYVVEKIERKYHPPKDSEKKQNSSRSHKRTFKRLHTLIRDASRNSFLGKFQCPGLLKPSPSAEKGTSQSESLGIAQAFFSTFGFHPQAAKESAYDEEHKGGNGENPSTKLSRGFTSNHASKCALSEVFQSLRQQVPHLLFQKKPTGNGESCSPLTDRLIHIFPVNSPKYAKNFAHLYAMLEKAHEGVDSQKKDLFSSALKRLKATSAIKQSHYSSIITEGPVEGHPEFYSFVVQPHYKDLIIASFIQAIQVNPTSQEQSFKIFQRFLSIIKALQTRRKISAKYCLIKTDSFVSNYIQNEENSFETVPHLHGFKKIHAKLEKKNSEESYYVIEEYKGNKHKKADSPRICHLHTMIQSIPTPPLSETLLHSHQLTYWSTEDNWDVLKSFF